MKHGHNGQSYPFDKMTPLMPKKERKLHHILPDGSPIYITLGYGSVGRQLMKKRYKKKQRQYNKQLTKPKVHD